MRGRTVCTVDAQERIPEKGSRESSEEVSYFSLTERSERALVLIHEWLDAMRLRACHDMTH